jgi:signal transduction histidine kinase
MMVVPLVLGSTKLGYLSIRSDKEDFFSEDDLDLGEHLGQLAALALRVTMMSSDATDAAILRERARMAHEIHDTLAQDFAAITLQAEAARSAAEESRLDRTFERLDRIQEIARSGLQEARRSIWALRPLALQDGDLASALARTVEMARPDFSGKIEFTHDGSQSRIPLLAQPDILKIAQEALKNSVHHGSAKIISVRFEVCNDTAILTVSDDGEGFELEGVSNYARGLMVLRERASRIGAELEIKTAIGKGTTVELRLALPANPVS